ncbi:MAG: 6-hydroxymethylpterin diphosphokinase MptE-like protein [Candidatus Thermoplasmatota archaeon]|nr:6-hydroxymethylpterin diphosphokinase MptE-like protein [Candidatus Thermoplasmatota archaeon]
MQDEINFQFGFVRSREEVSSRLISRLYKPEGNLSDILLNQEVTIVGAGIDDDEKIPSGVLIAADGAVSACLERQLIPDIVVTDLDGNLLDIMFANESGSKIVLHGHGDNLSKLFEFYTRIKVISLTTTYPSDMSNCWGGFTDGDRALMMSLSQGVSLVNLVGFNFSKVGKYTGKYSPKKLQKLDWARRIVEKCQDQTGKVEIY